jgi:chromosome segregation ATPase
MTALELRNELRRIDVDANGMMALLEYLLFKFRRMVTACLNNPQGGGPEEQKALAEAQRQVEELNKALADLTVQLGVQREAEAAAKSAESKAKAAEAILKAAEAEAKAAQAEFQKQEDDYKKQISSLEAKTKNESIGMVARNKAVQELAQLKGQDPLPLRRAKITQDAAVRKVELERKLAEAARKQAETQRAAAEEQTKLTEKAVEETERKCAEASETLEKLKQRGGVPRGAIWWMQREVTEAKKYMPRSKQ